MWLILARTSALIALALATSVAGLAQTIGPRVLRTAQRRPLPKGDRMLAMSINEPQNGNFDAAFQLAKSAGVQASSLALAWDTLETASGVFDPAVDWLQIADVYYPASNTPIVLEINPIDTNNLRVPADLMGVSFDDGALIQRFETLLDYVFASIPNLELAGFVIGNEIDISLGSSVAQWHAYETFFAQVATHARSLRPGLRVGCKITFVGLSGPAQPLALDLNRHTDIVMVNHYPLAYDFTVLPPASIHATFDTVAALYPQRKIFFSELGYPAGALCKSSNRLQADFMREAFRAWDRHRDSIELIEFVWMHDISQQELDFYEQYYGIADPVFLAYLGTLGLRAYSGSGTDKQAFRVLVREAALRGW